MKIITPGLISKDLASQLKGMVVRAVVHQNGFVEYIFQPYGQNNDGERLMAFRITEERLEKREYIEIDVPTEILGSIVEDTGTGIKGTATNLIYHESGCVHVDVQPAGLNKHNDIIAPLEVDILRLKGKKIPKSTEAEKAAARNERPSPGSVKMIKSSY